MNKRDKAAQGGRQDAGPHAHPRGFGSRVQSALGRLAPKSWGAGHSHAQHPADSTANSSRSTGSRQHRRGPSGDLELSACQSTSSIGTEAGAASDGAGTSTPHGDPSRPQTGSISHISSAGSLGAVTNDANSVASGSSARHVSTGVHAGGLATPADDLCSIATQAGSAAHSFTSLSSMMTTGHGDASSDGGVSLIPAGPATAAASDRAVGLSTSPTAAGSSTLSLLSAYRSSDAGGDATSVSTLPLISETGFDEGPRGLDERLLDVQTLAEEQEGPTDGTSEGMPEPSSDSLLQPKGRISSSHGSYTSLASNASEGPGGLAGPCLGPVARMPSPAHSRMAHSQRSSSRHSFQQQLQQQLLQDLEESQEEGSISAGLPVPFSSRRRPDNDDMCSYATQAGSSVHSLSSVMSHLENTQSQRGQWSSDGNALPTAGSSKSFSSLQQQQPSRSRRSSAETAGAHTAAASPMRYVGTSGAVSPVTDFDSGRSSPTAGHGSGGQFEGGSSPPGLQRKGSLKGALKSISRWGSGISQRLQRTGSGTQQQQQQQQQHGQRLLSQGSLPSGDAAVGSTGQELADFRRHVTD